MFQNLKTVTRKRVPSAEGPLWREDAFFQGLKILAASGNYFSFQKILCCCSWFKAELEWGSQGVVWGLWDLDQGVVLESWSSKNSFVGRNLSSMLSFLLKALCSVGVMIEKWNKKKNQE